LVVPAGNAPASSGYQLGALPLSDETMAEGVGNAPTSACADPVFKTGAASLYLPAFRGIHDLPLMIYDLRGLHSFKSSIVNQKS
jgi:hypothetical protein